jgi:hypothetical protein
MRQAATWLMVFGFGSMILHFIGMEFILLMWIDMWGTAIGWTLRILMALTGVALFVLSRVQGA